MKKITVLHLVNMLVDSSISRIVQRIMLSSDANEFSWYVWAGRKGGDFADVFAQAGAQIVDISGMEGNFLNTSRAVGKFAAENGVDIVHTHTPRMILTAWLGLRGKRQIKHLTTKHLLTTSADRNLGFLYANFDRLSLMFPDRVVAVSQWMGDEICRFPGIHKDRVSVIQNAIPVEQFFCPTLRQECRVEFQVPTNAMLIGYIGRIDIVKRIDLLLAAFHGVLESYPKSVLLIAGEGKLQNQMKDLARQIGVEQSVRWAGFRKDIPRLLAGIDIYVQPSINEGLSLSLMEAMAAKKAVIATNVGGTKEIIQNGINGLLIPPGSVEALCDTLLNMIRSQELCQALSEKAYCTAQEYFDLRKNVEGYYQQYRILAHQKHPPEVGINQ
jgi:glycosyltransferase involved in cell wall biosynthesis